jgi:hypothetical protein
MVGLNLSEPDKTTIGYAAIFSRTAKSRKLRLDVSQRSRDSGRKELEAMHDKSIYITENDAMRLQALLEVAKRSQYYGSDNLQKLGAELNRAKVLAILYQPEASGDYHL